MNNYAFPEIFVEGEKGEKYIIRQNNEYYLVEHRIPKNYDTIYGHILYEDIIEKAIDLLSSRTTREFIVIPKYTGAKEMQAYLVKADINICLVEVKGISPYVLINEEDIIDEGDKIALIITGKNEVRVVRSPCKGVPVLIVNFPWEKPERYIIVVVDKNDVRRITVRKST